MKQTRTASRDRLSRDATALHRLATGLSESGGKAEDHYWETQLAELVNSLLKNGAEDDINASLESLYEANPGAHDVLADQIEASAESMSIEIDGQPCTALLVAIPILAWSRYNVPSGNLPLKLLETLKTQLAAHLLSAPARVALADYLFSPDQLPRSFCATRTLLTSITDAVQAGTALKVDAGTLPETNRFLADVRYLLAGVIVPAEAPIFRWQENDGDRQAALLAWQQQGLPNLEPLLAGCAYEGLLANAYHAACRQADRAIRPYAVQATVAFLHAVVNLTPETIQATVGGCYDRRLIEYRIALGPKDNQEVFHGVVWPLLGEDENEENTDIPGDIEKALHAAGVQDIRFLEQQFPMEFCDDCGSPFYPTREGELVHTELPESVEQNNMTLH